MDDRFNFDRDDDEFVGKYFPIIVVRVTRALAFFLLALLLFWIAPVRMPNTFIVSVLIGFLALINQGSRLSLVALGFLMLLAIAPHSVIDRFIG